MERLGTTLTQHILLSERLHPEATGEFSLLLTAIGLAGKVISREVNRAGIVEGVLGLAGKVNVQGEEVQKLDEYANDTMIKVLGRSGHVCIMASEENDEAIPVPDDVPRGNYAVLFDPLDGSSNIDVTAPIGTIFSIRRKKSAGAGGSLEDLLAPGSEQVAAGYIVYGSSTVMIYTAGNGVHGFTLDPTVGEFLLSHPEIVIPERGKSYSVNEGNSVRWDEGQLRLVAWLKQEDKASGRPYGQRYIGSLVADFHRTLLKGGLFMYPADRKSPQGKLRLLYEAAPLAFICERAGGAASDGKRRILDIEPTSLHQRVPLFIGSRSDVELAQRFLAGEA